MNDQINGARDATKTNTTHVETFKSWELGYLGYFQNGKPIFYKASLRRHTAAAEFDISKVTALPRVDIVYLHVNCDDILVRAAVSAGALGIVIAAFVWSRESAYQYKACPDQDCSKWYSCSTQYEGR